MCQLFIINLHYKHNTAQSTKAEMYVMCVCVLTCKMCQSLVNYLLSPAIDIAATSRV